MKKQIINLINEFNKEVGASIRLGVWQVENMTKKELEAIKESFMWESMDLKIGNYVYEFSFVNFDNHDELDIYKQEVEVYELHNG